MLLHKNIIKIILRAQKTAIMKIKNYVLILLLLVLGFYSCGPDDGDDVGITIAEAIDRFDQYNNVEKDSIENYLSTHFFNYEEFEADPTSTTYKVVIDTIAGMNEDKISLLAQYDQNGNNYLHSKIVTDSDDVEYQLYYLKVREGEGVQPAFADSTYMTYSGNMIDDDYVFDSKVTPDWLPLHFSLQGFREIMVEFKGATGEPINNGDGTFTFENFGIGAMFIPSGLAYYNTPSSGSGINTYAPLIFTFQLINAKPADDDGDNVLNIDEDLDDDRDVFSDDTDEDLIPDFLDTDDDGDGTLTIYEDLEPDTDLNTDRDGDGDPTNDFGDGNPMNDDSDNDGIPNYLDEDSTDSNQDM